MICTKCFIDKPVEEYDSYYHSTQKKQRTRKYCKTCFKEQKKKYKESTRMKKIIEPEVQELEIVILEPQPVEQINPDYKQCRTCGEFKNRIDDYYHHGKSNKTTYLDCKVCCNKKENDRKKKERQEYLEDNCGSDKVPVKPNTYKDIYQQRQTFELMELLGYTYDDSGIWLKPGVKELVEGKLVFKKLRKRKYTSVHRIDYDHPVWKEMYDLYESGNYSYLQLSNKYGFNVTSICQYVKRVRNGKTH